MGYTHYWTQKRNVTKAQWADVCEHVGAILKYAQDAGGVPLADGLGDPGTKPEITPDRIAFNGVGLDGDYETMEVLRKREPDNSWFCKTERRPYDVVVTAVLAYLSTVAETHDVTSDGKGEDWLAGVDLARQALPQFANVLDIPMDIMCADRWIMPWINNKAKGFEVHFCVDGCGYVLRPRTGESYKFASHAELAMFLNRTKARGREENIWNPMGSFGQARWDSIASLQRNELRKLFPVPMANAGQPPSHIRPGNFMPRPETPYWFTDFFKEEVAS